jgi:hypothetical protein
MAGDLATALGGGEIRLFSGAVPVNCQAADPAGQLASGTLPATAATASGGVASKSGSWGFTGSAGGTAQTFRLYDSSAVCIHQGTVTAAGGGGDMIIDNPVIAVSQAGSVTVYTVTMGGA